MNNVRGMPLSKLAQSQRGAGGIAIIFAMMVVTVVSAIAIKQSWRAELDLTRAGHRWLSVQAKAYAEGAEQLAVIALDRDLRENRVDTLSELWAAGFDFPTDHGAMRITITDAQSKFNLNSLKEDFNTGQGVVGANQYKAPHKRFIRLLQTIPIDEDQNVMTLDEAIAITAAVKDWVDGDHKIGGANGFDGAERDYYEQLEFPLTIPNKNMVSVSELLMVKGMTPALYQGLLPFVTVLGDNATGLNVHTIGPWLARVINDKNSLVPLSVEDGQALFGDISAGDITDNQIFLDLPFVSQNFSQAGGGGSNAGSRNSGSRNSGSGNTQSGLDLTGLVYATQWFQLETTITVGDHVRRGYSLIQRAQPGQVRVVRRSDTRF